MGFLTEHCTLRVLTRGILASCKPFVCGNSDLDDYFCNDATHYYEQLLGKTYCYTLDEDSSTIVCAFTLSNDSVRVDHLPGSRKKKVNSSIPSAKRFRRYPAVLIGRLGVNINFADKHFCGGKDISMRRVFNLLTGANKSNYIDNFLDRAVNAGDMATGLCKALRGDSEYAWFLS